MATAHRPSADSQRSAELDGVSRENRMLRELVAIYHHLTGLALQSADLQAVIELLAERMTCRVAVVSSTLDIVAAAAPEGVRGEATDRILESLLRNRLARVLGAVTQTRRALRLPPVGGAPSSVVAPILVGDEILAYLLTVEDARTDAGEDASLLVTEHAATICGVVMGRERVVAAAAGRVRDDLVEGLLLGRAADADEARRWAQHLGYDSARGHQVMSLTVEDQRDEPPNAEATPRRR